eukprot:GEMP01144993.1.p1 GENE.GEMP01144993.1~~GEMP01144993.1.p1  ORF type:complete len:102 (+),score=5.24 GEMP01144993.1:111-416(+)
MNRYLTTGLMEPKVESYTNGRRVEHLFFIAWNAIKKARKYVCMHTTTKKYYARKENSSHKNPAKKRNPVTSPSPIYNKSWSAKCFLYDFSNTQHKQMNNIL